MTKTIKIVCSTLFLFYSSTILLFAQEDKIISGIVIDAVTKEALPNASIFLKNKPIGTIADNNGNFNLSIHSKNHQDTLVVSYLGYADYLIKAGSITSPVKIELVSAITDLNEIVVNPYPPTYFINLAMKQVRNSYPEKPYQAEAYYKEKITENKSLLKFNECIVKTYFPDFLDSMKNQHQILLFRKAPKVEEMKFMAEERKEQEEKEFKKHPDQKKKTGTDFIFRLGGPGTLLYFSRVNIRNDDFLDSTKFKEFNYSFSNNSNYNGKEVMVIDFKSKGKVGYLKKQGKIYIDPATNAIFRIEGSGDFVIPVAYRPLLFLYGFSAQELSFNAEKEFQYYDGRWHAKYIHCIFKLNVTKKRWFSANEHSDFLVDLTYNALKLYNKGISPIDPAKRFNRDNDMETQVYPEPGVSWP